MIMALKDITSQEERKELDRARRSLTPEPMLEIEVTMPRFQPPELLAMFAQCHRITAHTNTRPSILQWQHFGQDVYDFARALGMGSHLANAEVEKMKSVVKLRFDLQCGPVNAAQAWSEAITLQNTAETSQTKKRKLSVEVDGQQAQNTGSAKRKRNRTAKRTPQTDPVKDTKTATPDLGPNVLPPAPVKREKAKKTAEAEIPGDSKTAKSKIMSLPAAKANHSPASEKHDANKKMGRVQKSPLTKGASIKEGKEKSGKPQLKAVGQSSHIVDTNVNSGEKNDGNISGQKGQNSVQLKDSTVTAVVADDDSFIDQRKRKRKRGKLRRSANGGSVDNLEPNDEAEARHNYLQSEIPERERGINIGPLDGKSSAPEALSKGPTIDSIHGIIKFNQNKNVETYKDNFSGLSKEERAFIRDEKSALEGNNGENASTEIAKDDGSKIDDNERNKALQNDIEKAKEKSTISPSSGKSIPQLKKEQREKEILDQDGKAKSILGAKQPIEKSRERRTRSKRTTAASKANGSEASFQNHS